MPGNYVVPLNIGYMSAYLQQSFGREVDVRLFKSPTHLLGSLTDSPSPHVIALSNYSWNQELNRKIIQKAATSLPETVVCVGGPHIRTDDAGITAYLRSHTDIDYYCMFEGEIPLGHLIERFLSEGLVPADSGDSELPGVAYLCEGQLVYPHLEFQKGTIENIPSPYLTGVLDDFIGSSKWVPLLETNRGCPFHCTFCVWGIAAMDKVRVFPIDRVLEEIRFVADHSPCPQWIVADANFGMLSRDIEIAREMRDAVDKQGIVQTVHVWWAKISSRHTVEIAKVLGRLSDPLAAVQTMDDTVLRNIKRDNIKLTTMTDLLGQFHQDDHKVSTDILAGLPGESLESHLTTLRRAFDLGFDRVDVGNIRLLPGSEMESDETRSTYGLRTKYRLISGSYGRYQGEATFEFEESVRGSKDISEEEMHSLRIIHFFNYALSNLGIAKALLRWLQLERGLNPVDVIISLATPGKDDALDEFLVEFDEEARAEWFETPEELADYYGVHFDELLANGFLKMNFKYLAKILLDKGFARRLLTAIIGGTHSAIALELMEFCFDRIYFLDDAVQTKERNYSEDLVDILRKVYPSNSFESTICRFEIDERTQLAIDYELKKFNFQKDPVRAIALTLESYSSHFLYDFKFGRAGSKEIVGNLMGSFDYRGQLGLPEPE